MTPAPEQTLRIGFAGSRQLFAAEPDASRRSRLLLELQRYVEAKLGPADPSGRERRPTPITVDLGLPQDSSLEGISQVAIGADTLFTRACRSLGIPQRIFLPESADAYLAATGSDGARDFDASEARESAELLASRHVLECRVVADSPEREKRFEQTNQAIVAASNVIVCIREARAVAKPGGTAHLLALAAESRLPALELCIEASPLALDVTERWFNRG